ncbi:MAG: hypothetical protein R3B05_02430 [Nitrospira sp.]
MQKTFGYDVDADDAKASGMLGIIKYVQRLKSRSQTRRTRR